MKNKITIGTIAIIVVAIALFISNSRNVRVVKAPEIVTPASPVGTYVSENLSAANAQGMSISMDIKEDSTLTITTRYEGKGSIIEKGTWKLNEDSALIVTITGNTKILYDRTLTEIYSRNGDSLTYIGDTYGSEGLSLKKATK